MARKIKDMTPFWNSTSPSPPQYTSNSQKMADEMANFHQQIQNSHNDPPPATREQLSTEALQGMPSIPNHVKMDLNNLLTYNEIDHALTTSPNGKAASMNGIPTDLYKEINNRHKKKKNNKTKIQHRKTTQSSLQ